MTMNDRTHIVILEQANRFYAGEASSLDAFRAIDAIANSTWNWYPGVLNDTRALFDHHVSELITTDL